MTKHIHVCGKENAFNQADKFMIGDYEYDPVRSGRAGYPVYFSTSGRYEYICDLGDRLEVNAEDGSTINVWIDETKKEKEGNDLLSLVKKINHEPSFEKAQGMLDMLNAIMGTKYDFLAGRVVRFENPDAHVAGRYSHAHDLYAELLCEAQHS